MYVHSQNGSVVSKQIQQYANINNIHVQTFWCIIRFRSVGSTIINVYRKSIIDMYSWLWKCELNDEMKENSDSTTFSMSFARRLSYKKEELFTICTWVHPGFSVGSVLLIILVFCVVLYCVLSVLFCFSSSCVLCTQCSQFIWIVHSWLTLRFSLTFTFIWQYSD